MSGVSQSLDARQKRALLAELVTEKHRKHFRVLDRAAYLNFGAQGLVPGPAREAMQAAYDQLDQDAPFTFPGKVAVLQRATEARQALASELGAPPETIALLNSTSTGCNIVLWGLPWRKGDRIVLGNHEYPGVTAAVRAVAERCDLTVDSWSVDGEPEEALDRLKGLLRPETRLLVVSHIAWDTGKTLPLAEAVALCRERGVRVLADGAQSAGAMPLDLTALGADYYAFSGQKWLCGPEGTGGLYIRPDALASLRPTFVGPHGLRYGSDGEPTGFHPDSRRFEVSGLPTPLFSALRAAIELHRRWGSAADRFKRIGELSRALWERLRALERDGLPFEPTPEPPENGLVFVGVDDNAGLERALEADGLLTRSIPGTRLLRVSVHYLTLYKELDRLTEAMARLRPAREPVVPGAIA